VRNPRLKKILFEHTMRQQKEHGLGVCGSTFLLALLSLLVLLVLVCLVSNASAEGRATTMVMSSTGGSSVRNDDVEEQRDDQRQFPRSHAKRELSRTGSTLIPVRTATVCCALFFLLGFIVIVYVLSRTKCGWWLASSHTPLSSPCCCSSDVRGCHHLQCGGTQCALYSIVVT
jgi:ABC-type uncharacterized transport system permease subunit